MEFSVVRDTVVKDRWVLQVFTGKWRKLGKYEIWLLRQYKRKKVVDRSPLDRQGQILYPAAPRIMRSLARQAAGA